MTALARSAAIVDDRPALSSGRAPHMNKPAETHRKGNVRRWKPLPNNGSEDITVDTGVCVIVYCKV
jgi:hypothetical protein